MLCREYHPCRRCGAGHTLKLLHNFVSLGFSAVLAEAAAASRRAGIDDAAFLEVVGKGGGGGVVFDRLRPFIASDDPSGFNFSVANATKDLGYYRAMTGELGLAAWSQRPSRRCIRVSMIRT